MMKDFIELASMIKGESVLSAIFLLMACAFLVIKMFQTLWGWFMWLYRKQKGIETKEERMAKIEETMIKMQTDHAAEMQELRDKENDDIKEIKVILTGIAESLEEEKAERKERDLNEQQFNRVVMRSTILTGVDELRKADWVCSPARKQNMDELFECYFRNKGNGEIEMLKTNEYDVKIQVDYQKMY